MEYAVTTKFIGPTNTRGARVKATLPSGKSVSLSWDHSLEAGENHHKAAKACVQKYVIDSTTYLFDKTPWAHKTFEVHGLKSGFVCIVRLLNK